MSPLLRYALFQLPALVGVALLAYALWHWLGVPGWIVIAGVSIWVAKDVVLYPFLRRAHEPSPEGAARLIGRRATARKRLAPRGTVSFGVELWSAEIEAKATPVDAGATVRVVGARGMTLIVAADDGIG